MGMFYIHNAVNRDVCVTPALRRDILPRDRVPPLFRWVFLPVSLVLVLLYIHGHSHSPPLSRPRLKIKDLIPYIALERQHVLTRHVTFKMYKSSSASYKLASSN